ncbi:hypothetical protein BH11BAC4_BH11BAC4_24080 [soil metagenome]
MFTVMEQDGLINLKKGFMLEYNGIERYINGSKQTEEVTGKYRKIF